MRLLPLSLLFASGIALFSCDDTTSILGIDTMPDADNVTTSTASYRFNSRTIEVDSVLANTNVCYLGSVIDPETRAKTTCDFLAQFSVMEDLKFPSIDRIVKDERGNPVVDSCDIRIYFDSYYGDSLASMKLFVQELDTARVMEEGVKYYTDFSPADYVNPRPDAPKKQLVYSVKDLTRPDSETDGSTYYRSVLVKLLESYGQFLLKKYYENPDYYSNSYQFVRHVCPGFYFKTAGGVGSMINSSLMALNIHFRYHTKNEAGNDTIVDGMQRLGATEEVIQNTNIDSRVPDHMLTSSQGYTYIKSPASLFTELSLPVADIVKGEHANDSINQAKLLVGAFNNTSDNPHALKAPASVVLVRKKEMFSFFEKEELPDNETSYLSEFDSSTQAYEFSNLTRLISTMRVERDMGAGVLSTDDEATRQAKYAAWEAKPENADWNKAVLVPVNAEYRTTTSYGQTTQTLVRVLNSFGLNSVKLRGGDAGALQMDIIYSRFNR